MPIEPVGSAVSTPNSRIDLSQINDVVDVDAGHVLFGEDRVECDRGGAPLRREPMGSFQPRLWPGRDPRRHPIPRRIGDYAVFHGSVRTCGLPGARRLGLQSARRLVLEHPIRVIDRHGQQILFDGVGWVHLEDCKDLGEGGVAICARLDLIHGRFVGVSGITNLSAGEPRYDGEVFRSGHGTELLELRFAKTTPRGEAVASIPRQGFAVFAPPRRGQYPTRAFYGRRTFWKRPEYNTFGGFDDIVTPRWSAPSAREHDHIAVGFCEVTFDGRSLRLLGSTEDNEGCATYLWYFDRGVPKQPEDPTGRIFAVRNVGNRSVQLVQVLNGLPAGA